MKGKKNQPILDAVMVQAAKNKKEDARAEEADVIEALKDANEQRDIMIVDLMGDLVEMKKEVERYRRTLHELVMRYQEIRDAEERGENGD